MVEGKIGENEVVWAIDPSSRSFSPVKPHATTEVFVMPSQSGCH
jgi:hypothetical protein